MTNCLQDLRYAFRQLRNSPGFTVAALLTLAIAIGANAVVFAALDGIVLRLLNIPRAQSLFEIGRTSGDKESYPNYLDLRDRSHSFEALAAAAFSQDALDTGNDAARVWGFQTTGNYFDVLGVQPYLGRLFHASDEQGLNSAPHIVQGIRIRRRMAPREVSSMRLFALLLVLAAMDVSFASAQDEPCPPKALVPATDAAYAEAMGLARTLNMKGITVHCVMLSKEARMFEGELGAAFFRSDIGNQRLST
jgi:hypothetical protein